MGNLHEGSFNNDTTEKFLKTNDERDRDEVPSSSNYADYDNVEDLNGLTTQEALLFDERCPTNHKKVRLISKTMTQVFWLMIVND